MLEPDRLFGRAYLEALRKVRGGYVVGPHEASKFALISGLKDTEAEVYLRSFAAEVQMVSQIMVSQRMATYDAFRVGMPEIVTLSDEEPVEGNGMMIFDHTSPKVTDGEIKIRSGQPVSITGWIMMDQISRPYPWGRIAYLILTSSDNARIFHVPISRWMQRTDVSEHYNLKLDAENCYFGFELNVSTDIVSFGTYRVSVIQAMQGKLLSAPCYTLWRKTAS